MPITILSSNATTTEPGTTVRPCAVFHAEGCPCLPCAQPDSTRTEKAAECLPACHVEYFHTSHVGRVVHLREMNGYDDSDFYATVLGDDGKYTEVCYASTRGWSYWNGATIDGDVAAYEAHRQAVAVKSAAYRREREAAAVAKIPAKGARVVVTSTRSKVPHGTEGEVFWFGMSISGRAQQASSSRYRNPYASMLYTASEEVALNLKRYRVGLRLADGSKVFCAASCVEVLQPAPA